MFNDLSDNEIIERAREFFGDSQKERFQPLLKALQNKEAFFREFLKGQRVVDIGCGSKINDLAVYLFQLGIKEYIGVEPYGYKPHFMDSVSARVIANELTENQAKVIQYHDTDGLSHILTLPDESAVMMATGSLGHILHCNGALVLPQHEEYCHRLGIQIYRVTPKGSIFFGDEIYQDTTQSLVDSGFRELVGFKNLDSRDREKYFGTNDRYLFLFMKD